jgi:cytochrome d ubiquinol oxidase subunit II
MDMFGDPAIWLPWTFAALMGLSILIYVVRDGFDLDVGLLMPLASEGEKDQLVASIGPFWTPMKHGWFWPLDCCWWPSHLRTGSP